jgi:alkyl sulfatase BDS1-like metallo-beta-lactamase superfamily hydrolase
MTLVEGHQGVIVIDPLISTETAGDLRFAAELLNHLLDDPDPTFAVVTP